MFFQMTRRRVFCPEAEIPESRRNWYRFLTRQVVVTYSTRVFVTAVFWCSAQYTATGNSIVILGD
jgi:hypothetical protein